MIKQVEPLSNADGIESSSQVAAQELEVDYPEIESTGDNAAAEPILENVEGYNLQAESTAGVVEKEPLASSWQELKDPNTGVIYYYNSVRGATQWDRPEELKSSVTEEIGTPMVNIEEEEEAIDAGQQVTSFYRRYLSVITVY